MNKLIMKRMHKGNNKNKYCYLFLFNFVLLNFIATPLICNKGLAQEENVAVPVVVSRAVLMDVPKHVKIVGTVFPFRESMVAGEVEGLVEVFPVKKGDCVEKGQVLAKLKTKTLEIQLKGANAMLDVKKAAIGEAEASERLALMEYQRAKELVESLTISSQEFDGFRTKYERAIETNKKERAGLAAQEVEVERFQDYLEKCTILAPFRGRIIEEYVEKGQWINKGSSVVSMIQINFVKVRLPVPEKYIQNLKVGDECNVSISSLGAFSKTGKIIHIVPQADARSRTFPVYVKLENRDEIIMSGMFAEATFQIGPLLSATMVVKDAIVRRGGSKLVFISVDGKAVAVPVQTGIFYKNLVRIIGDVKPGTDVVIRGNERLRNGLEMQVTGRKDPDLN